MKRLLTTLIACLLVLGAVGCSQSGTTGDSTTAPAAATAGK